MKLTGARIESFVRRPPADIAAALVFGPDRGLVRERADALASTVVDDPSDPFRTADLDAAQLKSEPGLLGDEAAAVALGGGRRLVRVRGAGDDVGTVFAAFLESADPAQALVVVDAGELTPRSSLRRAFEGAANAAAVPCYADDTRSLTAVIVETLGAHGLKAAPDALAYLAANLGADREVTRSELEKLALYKGGPGTVALEDAAACVGDSAATSLDQVVFAAGAGNAAALEKALARAFSEGIAPVSVLRAAARHFQRLHWVRGRMKGGKTLDQAVAGLRPPPIFLVADAFKAQARRWSPAGLARVLELLIEAELDCKTTGMPDTTVCGRTLFRIANAAARSARG